MHVNRQHELEDSLGADRQVVSKLVDKFHDAAAVSADTPPEPVSMDNNTAVRKTSKLMLLSSSQPKGNVSSRTPREGGNNGGSGVCRVGKSAHQSVGRIRDHRSGEITGAQTPTAAPICSSSVFMPDTSEEACEGDARKGAILSPTTESVRPALEKDKEIVVPSASSLRLAREAKTPTAATKNYVANRKTIIEQQQHQQRPSRQQQAYKREIRARRKAKERARRRARSADERGHSKYNAESGCEQSDGRNNTDGKGSRRKQQYHNAPKPVLEPIAPTLVEGVPDEGGEGPDMEDTGVGRTMDTIDDASDETNIQNTSAIVDWSHARSASQEDAGGGRPMKTAEVLFACGTNEGQHHEQCQGRRPDREEFEHCSEYGDDFEDDASISLDLDKAQHEKPL